MAVVDRFQCEYCGEWFDREHGRQRFCKPAHRLAAFRERQRVAGRMADYKLSDADMKQVRDIQKYSAEAGNAILRVCALAGAVVAEEMLDACWALLVACGELDKA